VKGSRDTDLHLLTLSQDLLTFLSLSLLSAHPLLHQQNPDVEFNVMFGNAQGNA
jgi:hypothetical protein